MATTAAAAAKAPAEAAPEAAPKKSNKPLLIIIIVVVLLALGGAGAWFFLLNSDEDEAPQASAKPPVFLPLDQFTVNLQPEDGQQFLQVAMTLKVVDQAVADAIKAQLPEVRSRVLLLLSSKKASQLLSLEGKTSLAAEIVAEIEMPITPVKPAAAKKLPSKNQGSSEGADGGTEAKAVKTVTAKAKGKAKDGKAGAARPRVLAVFFTHFIVQ